MPGNLTLAEIIDLLNLAPLPGEGGFYRQTVMGPDTNPERIHAPSHTAILYLVTPQSWSGLHMLQSDELFHFYMSVTNAEWLYAHLMERLKNAASGHRGVRCKRWFPPARGKAPGWSRAAPTGTPCSVRR